ncbi:hypothetical protein D3C86_2091370 [compost metagenome]
MGIDARGERIVLDFRIQLVRRIELAGEWDVADRLRHQRLECFGGGHELSLQHFAANALEQRGKVFELVLGDVAQHVRV